MAARAYVAVDVPGLVVTHIDHGRADSFSRAVLPAANRAWRKAINYGAATMCRVAELAPDFSDDGGECTSFVAYGPTLAVAREALEAHVEVLKSASESVSSPV
jgi:hypothetical protein